MDISLFWGNPGLCPSPSTTTCRSPRRERILGSARFAEIAARNNATVNIKPCKFGPIFEQTGGLPLPKRSPQRRAYRMMELKRWREALGIPINFEPKHFPCDDTAATRLVIAARLQGKNAHRLSLELGRAVWEREETLADPAAISLAAQRAGLDAAELRAGGVPRTPKSISCMRSLPRRRSARASSVRRAMCCLRGRSSGARTGWNCWNVL